MSLCLHCKHSHRSTAVAQDKSIQTLVQCVRFPPQMIVLMQQTALGVQQAITPVYPQVNEQSVACSEYAEKVVAIKI